MDQPREIVLTYRPDHRAEPVELTYERPLPQGMLRRTEELVPAWRSATDPPERQKSRWGVRLFVTISLLVALVCLGVGIWYVQTYGWNLPAEKDPAVDNELPYEDPYYWEDRFAAEEETTIRSYRPFGGSVAKLELQSAGEDAEVLTAGEVYDTLRSSTVTVLGISGQAYSVGTGIVFSADGYVLTNYHVISGCGTCQVWVTDAYGVDQTYDAMLVGGDEKQDLAVLKIDAPDLVPAEFGVSDDLAIGDKVYAIGNPLGLDLRGTFTDGIVSAIDRDVDVDGVTMTLIQTNTALNSGNSGGPLINQYGQVVGVNTIKMMSGYDTIEGLGFAIPTSLAVRWVNELIRFGEIQPQPVLGISINKVPETLPDGAIGLQVMTVTRHGSGDLAGVRVGDYVVAFAGRTVTRTEEILALRRDLSVGDKVVIRVWRDGEYLDIEMTMLAEAGTESGSAQSAKPNIPKNGIITPQDPNADTPREDIIEGGTPLDPQEDGEKTYRFGN